MQQLLMKEKPRRHFCRRGEDQVCLNVTVLINCNAVLREVDDERVAKAVAVTIVGLEGLCHGFVCGKDESVFTLDWRADAEVLAFHRSEV